MRAAANLFFGKGSEPAFDLIEPRSRGGREMDVEARMASKPVPNRRSLVRPVIVHHEMNVQVSWYGSLDCAQEFQEFTAAMTAV